MTPLSHGTPAEGHPARIPAVASCGEVGPNLGQSFARPRLMASHERSLTKKRTVVPNLATVLADVNGADKMTTASSCCQWHNAPFLFEDSTLDSPRASFVLYFPSRVCTDIDPQESPQRGPGAHYHSMPFLERAPASDPSSDSPLKARSLCMIPYCSFPGHMLMVVPST